MSELSKYMDGPVRKLVEPIQIKMPPQEQERHRIYCLLLMAIVAFNFCGNRPKAKDKPAPDGHGINPLLPPDHEYAKRGIFLNRDYLGHNIAAIAVDRNGQIIDFDFNHNELFNSSVEHAEARLLNRVFKLSKIHDSWAIGPQPNEPAENRYGNALRGVTIYTSLESCAQCSGIMTLGNVKDVIYLQEDPGQYKIGNIMYRLTAPINPGEKHLAPRPIPASLVGLDAFDKLNAAYNAFYEKHRNGMTAFLCTEAAYKIFLEAEQALVDHQVIHRDEADPKSPRLTNEGVKVECLSFYQYVVDKGRRGTPH
ncbi:hypothetical protein [Massilia sp. IC2-476]|uniref:hypothetical protein n=1 Tax=Massilia sp. IC2-476 TaxID=2887199 RepID=UPI001D11B2AE|nr:hypothetical protein [Massilia sp. IC2-476]MCC2973580.1 hypothetical protein [Massilia sp. IC2-476]